MRVGVMADSHDNVPMIRRACELFNRREVDMVLHCGDYIAPFSINPLNQILQMDYRGVFGNNDGEHLGLEKTAGTKIQPAPFELSIGTWQVLICHDLPDPRAATRGKGYRLVAFGHTHRPEIKKEGGTLFVNPGECGGWLYGRWTVAIADLDTLKAEIIDL